MPKDNNDLCICYQCSDTLLSSQFYKSYSRLYAGTGHLPICKNCFEQEFKIYRDEYQNSKKAFKRLCMAYDLYYNDDMFDSCDDDNTLIGKYFRKLNMVQCKGKTFDTTIKEGFDFFDNKTAPKPVVKEEDDDSDSIDPKDIEKWGVGLDPADYDVLNSHYRLLSNSNPQCDSNAEIFITDLCYTKMQQLKAIRESRVDDYKKLTESYIKSFKQAGLKTVKDTNAMEDFTIGVNAETIEKYTPAEYYKNRSLYKDHDNIGDYITRFLLRPLRNLMQGIKDRDEEFFVRDEEETDGFADDE